MHAGKKIEQACFFQKEKTMMPILNDIGKGKTIVLFAIFSKNSIQRKGIKERLLLEEGKEKDRHDQCARSSSV
jgi:hypothetical protein